MSTLIVYAETSDGYLYSTNANYATAAAGSGVTAAGGTTFTVGQTGASPYYLYEGFLQYDTSSLTEPAVISSVKEELYLSQDRTTTNYTEEVRAFDWGESLGTDDWVASANLGNYTLLSSKAVSPAAGYNEFPDSANFQAAINKTGYTRLLHNSDRQRLGTAPSGWEYTIWAASDTEGTTNDPKLTIEYTVDILPQNLYPNSDSIQYNSENVFTWEIAEQSAYELEYRLSGGDWVSTGKITSTTQSHTFPAETFSNDSSYEWHVQVYDDLDATDGYSDTATFTTYEAVIIRFLSDPSVTVRMPIATHVIVQSPTHSATAYVTPEPAAEVRIERLVKIDSGDATICQAVADELIDRWGRNQVSVSGPIPLDVRLRFKSMVSIKIPQAGINQLMILQRKEHDITDMTTTVTLGDILLDDNELIARILDELTL